MSWDMSWWLKEVHDCKMGGLDGITKGVDELKFDKQI